MSYRIKPKLSPETALVNVELPKLEAAPPPAALLTHSVFDRLSDGAYLRAAQLVRSTKSPDSTAPLPFSAPTLWRKVREGTFPAPRRLSTRVTAWRVGDIRKWLEAQA